MQRVDAMQYDQTNVPAKKNVLSAKKTTAELSLADLNNDQASAIHLQDYVNVFVTNKVGDVLVLEEMKNGRSWSSWQLIGTSLRDNEDPMLAIQQELRQHIGYTCEEWIYLGTFVIDESQKEGAGHFFCARLTEQTITEKKHANLKWVKPRELKQALLDGRIAVINHATAISLAMIMCNSYE